MRRVWGWAKAGGRAELIASPDAICRVCPEQGDCRAEERDQRLLELTGWPAGEKFSVAEKILFLIPERPRWVREVCSDCPWFELCQKTIASF